MSTLEPGVYKATVRSMPNVVVMMDDGASARVLSLTAVDGCYWHTEHNVTDARRLILLDLSHLANDYPSVLRKHGFPLLADQIEEQSKPPRIEEPGLWGVVNAGGRAHVRHVDGWISTGGREYRWSELVDPTLIREGLS